MRSVASKRLTGSGPAVACDDRSEGVTRLPAGTKIPRISEGEEALWTQMRMEMADYLPEREYGFDPAASGRKWRFDFAWPKWRIAVEVEGGTWSQGRHTRGSSFEADLRKYNAAALAGWLVLRVSTEMIVVGTRSMDEAIGLVKLALTLRVTQWCRWCNSQWRPLASPDEAKRHVEFATGLRRCQGHEPKHCSPGCTSDHK